MRLLHVVPTYLPAVRYGGPIFSVHGLCKALARAGHEVHVFTTSVDGAGDSRVPLEEPVGLDGVTVWYFASTWLRRLYRAPGLARALRSRVEGFDLVHTHSVFLWPTWKASAAARGAGRPCIVSPRGMLVDELVRRKSTLAKRAWIAAIERRNLESAAAVHVTSADEAAQLDRFGFALKRVEVIPNGVDLPATRPVRANAGAADPGRAPLLLFLGRINWKKGLDRLIDAMPHIPRATLVIAGNDEEGYTPELERRARAVGVAGRIEFAPGAYGPDKEALFARADLLVLPSYSENFGNVVLEALAAGCPVAVTAEVGASGLVEATGGGEILPGEPRALGEGLARMLADPARLRALGERGREAVARDHSWDLVAARMAGLYAEVAGTGGAR